MSKHTKGPWSVNPAQTGVEVFGADGQSLMSLNRSADELLANARLIAAAPDLLEALISLKKAVNYRAAVVVSNDYKRIEFAEQEVWSAVDFAAEVIAKATGEQQ